LRRTGTVGNSPRAGRGGCVLVPTGIPARHAGSPCTQGAPTCESTCECQHAHAHWVRRRSPPPSQGPCGHRAENTERRAMPTSPSRVSAGKHRCGSWNVLPRTSSADLGQYPLVVDGPAGAKAREERSCPHGDANGEEAETQTACAHARWTWSQRSAKRQQGLLAGGQQTAQRCAGR
jgi:hypothetical protein